ncbi:MAG: chromate resistance protein, partial [Pseudomonadales bacterium]
MQRRMRQHKLLSMALAVVLVAVLTAGFTGRSRPHYVTWQSLEPDIWASIWLIKTHIDPNAKISLLPPGSKITSGVAFG